MHASCAVQYRKLYHTGMQLASRPLVVNTLKSPAGPYCFSTCRLMQNSVTHAAASAECIQLHVQASTPTRDAHLCALLKEVRTAAFPAAIPTNTAGTYTVQVQVHFSAAILTNTARTRTVQLQIHFPAASPTNTANMRSTTADMLPSSHCHRITAKA